MFKLVLEKAEEPEIKLTISAGSWKKQESSRETSISALLTVPKPLTVWITINVENSERNGNTRYLTCLLRNLYAGQEATVRTGYGTTDWFQIGKGVCQGCILSRCLFNLYAEYIVRNAGLEETQAGIKIAGKISITSDMQMTPPLWQTVKSFLMKEKEESGKVGLKLNIQKTKIMASSPITSWEIGGETMETVSDFIFGGLQNHCRW